MGASSSVIKTTENVAEGGVVFDFYAKYKSPDAYNMYVELLKEMEEAEKTNDIWRRMCGASSE